MDDPRWLRIIMVGLVLAALAVGYFLLTGRFVSKSTTKNTTITQTEVIETIPVSPPNSVLGQNAQATPAAMAAARRNITTLPATGYPQVLLAAIAVGIMISGLGLRKFPQ